MNKNSDNQLEDASNSTKENFEHQLKNDQISEKNISALLEIYNQKKSKREFEFLFKQFWAKTKFQQHASQINSWWRYAAIFVALLGLNLTILYFYRPIQKHPTQQTYSTPKTSISKTVMSDGSVIWLNSDSELKIIEDRNQITAVLKGEAFFNIVHNENRTFIVEAGKIKIKDLGTKFNIKAYENQQIVEAYLKEGDLDILDATNNMLSNLDPGGEVLF